MALGTPAGDVERLVAGLSAGGSTPVTLSVTFRCARGQCPCPVDLLVTADSRDEVTECDETNNTDTGTACCKY